MYALSISLRFVCTCRLAALSRSSQSLLLARTAPCPLHTVQASLCSLQCWCRPLLCNIVAALQVLELLLLYLITVFMNGLCVLQGLLKPGGTVVEGTAGNTGIGLAHVCRYILYYSFNN
jgi:hypothetical protein